MSDLLSRLESRTMPSQDVLICLDFDLLNARDEAMAGLSRAQSAARSQKQVEDDRLAGGTAEAPIVTAAKQLVAELEAQIRDASITLRIRGVDRHTYNGWMLECPPRKGQDTGRFNPAVFFMHAAKNSAVYVDAQGDEHPISDDEWAAINKSLTDGEHDRIAQAVINVNRTSGQVDVAPFVNASEKTVDSFGISGSRARSGSRRAASGAGSRAKFTKSSSTKRGAASSE
ncbi:hypothetical protein [Microbacterium sp. KNMS]